MVPIALTGFIAAAGNWSFTGVYDRSIAPLQNSKIRFGRAKKAYCALLDTHAEMNEAELTTASMRFK
jgi:hypothetical protein